jgi:hypothetical protein
MTESIKRKIILTGYGLWLVAFAVGFYRCGRSLVRYYRTLKQTQTLSQELNEESRHIEEAERDIHERTRDMNFLQGLMTLLPQSKSFIRTQRAMEDEVENLRYKVGRRVRNDLHVLVDTQANKLYVKKGLTLLWEADCSVGRGGILKDKITGRRWEFVTPRGQFDIREKIENPLWIKPDWALLKRRNLSLLPMTRVAMCLGNWAPTYLTWATVILFMELKTNPYWGMPCRMAAYA